MSCRDQKGGASDDVNGGGFELDPAAMDKFVEMGFSGLTLTITRCPTKS